jgi:hypothetical protein
MGRASWSTRRTAHEIPVITEGYSMRHVVHAAIDVFARILLATLVASALSLALVWLYRPIGNR